MKNYNSQSISKNYILILLSCLFFSIAMIIFPNVSLKAAQSGINIWFYSVVPALFPFFVFTKLMTYLGFHKIIGRLLEPIIRPIFNVPGEASFIFAMSLSSGYPLGVQMVSDLRKSESISKVEAERMLSFCSTSGPLFMLGTVGASMFNNPLIGFGIAISHYLASVLNGLLFRFYKRNTPFKKNFSQDNVRKIFWDCHNNFNNGKEFMTKISDAIYDSFKTLLLIGGFITLFSILTSLIDTLHILKYFSVILKNTLIYNIFLSCTKGFFEITLGCYEVSQIDNCGFILSTILCSSLISWSGLSIHAQVITLLSKTDIKKSIYILSKLTHTLFTILTSALVSSLLLKLSSSYLTTFNIYTITKNSNFIYNLLFSTKLMLFVSIIFFITVIIDSIRK